MIKDEGLRFNQGKQRYELLHPVAQEGIVKVLSKGAEKYAPKNWEKGMSWSSVVASLKRHLAEFEKGIDYDEETKLLHIDHIQCNAHFLSAFYKIAPQFDDRNHSYLKPKRIGLDIDDTINTFVDYWCETHKCDIPDHWHFDRKIGEKIKLLGKEFWLNIPCKILAKDIPFIPSCYITARSIPEDWTREWLDKNNFPHVPIYSVGFGQSKLEIAKKENLDFFIDDNFETFLEFNSNGICTFLMDMPHNKRHDVGYKRIIGLKDFSERFL